MCRLICLCSISCQCVLLIIKLCQFLLYFKCNLDFGCRAKLVAWLIAKCCALLLSFELYKKNHCIASAANCMHKLCYEIVQATHSKRNGLTLFRSGVTHVSYIVGAMYVSNSHQFELATSKSLHV